VRGDRRLGGRPVAISEKEPLTKALLRKTFEKTVARCEGIPGGERDRLTLHGLRTPRRAPYGRVGHPPLDVARDPRALDDRRHDALRAVRPAVGRSAIDALGARSPSRPAPSKARVATA